MTCFSLPPLAIVLLSQLLSPPHTPSSALPCRVCRSVLSERLLAERSGTGGGEGGNGWNVDHCSSSNTPLPAWEEPGLPRPSQPQIPACQDLLL